MHLIQPPANLAGIEAAIVERRIKIAHRDFQLSADDAYLQAMGDRFEPNTVQLLSALIEPSDIVADIGANIGPTALLFSSLAQKVSAFEPSPSTNRFLEANLARAGVTNVDAVNLGLGQKAEARTLTFAANFRAGGYVSEKIRPDKGCVTGEICIGTLDRYFGDREVVPSFMKIDVEGFEANVIKGGALLLARSRPVVVMEMNHFCLGVLHRVTLPDFLDYMRLVFQFLCAIDHDNVAIADLHDPDGAYWVRRGHVVRHRFPNLAGGFDGPIRAKMNALAASPLRSP